MDQISRKMVEVYLLWLEENKGCAVSTRNHRFTVIHALMRYIAVEESPVHVQMSGNTRNRL